MSAASMHPAEIELHAGELIARVRPDVGGSISAFWRVSDGQRIELLRAARSDAVHPLQMASFPLVPWCNRIEDGRFVWQGRSVQISPTDPLDRYPLHGFGWKAGWRVLSRSADEIELSWRYTPGEWPWAFEARQIIALRGSALHVDLRMTNLADGPAPAGLGHHPYVPLRTTTRLLTQVTHRCETNPALIPTQLAAVADGQVFDTRRPHGHVIDNSFVGWREPAVIEQPDHGVRLLMTAQPKHPVLAVYVPPSQDFFCVEPVQNTPNALNQPDFGAPMHTLAPGETLQSQMVLSVEELATSR